jgi:hypothetical protein
MPGQRNYTRELKNAILDGKRIVCAVEPYDGHTVTLDRTVSTHHPKPWFLPATGLRYSGRECKAVDR